MTKWLLPVALLVMGCSDKPLPGPPEWNRSVDEPADEVAATQRTACGFKAGALPAETQGKSHPNGKDIPVDHIIVMMMENRSFDHYFQKLPQHGWSDVEVAPADYHNVDNDGQPVLPKRDTSLCFVDTAHGWNAVHRQINGGKMDGFFSTNDQDHETPVMGGTIDQISGTRGLTYYEAEDLPVAYWIADKFAIADHYYSSVPGPTWPNRMYLYGATSRGRTTNDFVMNNDNTIFDELEKRKISWTIYYHRRPGFGVFIDRYLYYYSGEGMNSGDHAKNISYFWEDAKNGKLPQVVFIDPDIGYEGVGANDEHPPAVMQVGQKLMGQVVDAVLQSPTWKKTAMFITYDEHGGLYDHVAPPKACPPDDYAPELAAGDEAGGFDQYGVRVPFMVLSPYAKKHFVAHHTYDHTSILRFIEARFVMPALTGRDANAEAPWEMFDFSDGSNDAPGSPPEATVDQAKLDGCLAVFGPGGQ
jgi:phospholipase C